MTVLIIIIIVALVLMLGIVEARAQDMCVRLQEIIAQSGELLTNAQNRIEVLSLTAQDACISV